MKQPVTTAGLVPVSLPLASRRTWLKGFSALLGTGLLAAPAAVLAAPTPTDLQPASALVGGDEYIGVVKLLTGNKVPAGWLPCDGQELPVGQHPALFAILSNTYGGDGQTTFALPKLRELLPQAPELPVGMCAIKVANAPATATALAELRMEHQFQRKARPVA